MANWSDTWFEFRTDEKENALEIYNFFKSNTENNFYHSGKPKWCDKYSDDDYGFSGMEISDIELTHYDKKHIVTVSGMGRWHGPFTMAKCLAERYGTDLEYHDSESGCQFYHKIIAENGIVVDDLDLPYLGTDHIEYLGYESALSDLEWIAEVYVAAIKDEDAEEKAEYLDRIKEFSKNSGVPIDEVMKDLCIDDDAIKRVLLEEVRDVSNS